MTSFVKMKILFSAILLSLAGLNSNQTYVWDYFPFI